MSEQIYRSVLQPNNFMSFAVNLDLKEIFLSELRKTENMISKWTYKPTILIKMSLFDFNAVF